MQDRPFVHLMKTPYGFYFYDVNTNAIIQIEEDVYAALCEEETDLHTSTLKKLEHLKKKGYLLSDKLEKIKHPNTDSLPDLLQDSMHMITLQLTQECNFRCGYCIYSETKYKAQRTHGNYEMSESTAKRAIDFLLDHSREMPEVSIGFYGGEPLLKFDLIQKCVNYAKRVGDGKKITFSITTNASLLSDKIIEFFEKNNVNISISFDGPQIIHDQNRVFANSGKGTFDVIQSKMKHIYENYPKTFQSLHIMTVLDSQNDFDCINDFYNDADLFREIPLNASFIDDSYADSEKQKSSFASSKFYVGYQYEYFKMLLYLLKRLNEKNVSKITKLAVRNFEQLDDLFQEESKKVGTEGAPGGPCIPGVSRCFVDAFGNIFPCERVSEASEIMKIGHLNTGIDVMKASNLLNAAQITEKECKNCWAFRLCTACCKYCDGGVELSKEKRLGQCNQMRDNADARLRDYIALKECGR